MTAAAVHKLAAAANEGAMSDHHAVSAAALSPHTHYNVPVWPRSKSCLLLLRSTSKLVSSACYNPGTYCDFGGGVGRKKKMGPSNGDKPRKLEAEKKISRETINPYRILTGDRSGLATLGQEHQNRANAAYFDLGDGQCM